jgi:hypothetical protein
MEKQQQCTTIITSYYGLDSWLALCVLYIVIISTSVTGQRMNENEWKIQEKKKKLNSTTNLIPTLSSSPAFVVFSYQTALRQNANGQNRGLCCVVYVEKNQCENNEKNKKAKNVIKYNI